MNSRNLDALIPKIFFLFVVFITIYNLFFSQLNIIKVIELKSSLKDIENRRLQVEKENLKLEKLLNSIEKYPDYYREMFIRKYMQLQKDDESVILFYD